MENAVSLRVPLLVDFTEDCPGRTVILRMSIDHRPDGRHSRVERAQISLLLKEKAVIIDADEVTKKIMEPGKPAWAQVVEYFSRNTKRRKKNKSKKARGYCIF